MLCISIYNEIGRQEGDLGSHGRVKYYIGAPNLENILEAEKNGEFVNLSKSTEGPSYDSNGEKKHLVSEDNSRNIIAANNESFKIDNPKSILQDIQKFQPDNGKIFILSKLFRIKF